MDVETPRTPHSLLDDATERWDNVETCGRVCCFGEHSDWAGSHRVSNPGVLAGRTIVVGTNAGLRARVRKTSAFPRLVLRTRDDHERVHGPVDFPWNVDALKEEAHSGSFWAYCAGTAAAILESHKIDLSTGLVIDVYEMSLPLKKGLSSSAAVCVLVAKAMNQAYELGMDIAGIMDAAYRGERMTPSMCGRMDQACAYGSVPVLLQFDGDGVSVATLKVAKPIHLVLVDLCAKKDTVEILAKLQGCYPNPKSEDEENVHKLLGPINQDITGRAITAMAEGDVEAFGKLMTEAQGYFDLYAAKVCPSQLTAPVLHRVLAHPALQAHVYGGKGVGAGGDGTAQFVAKSEADQRAVAQILEKELGMPSFFVTIKPTAT